MRAGWPRCCSTTPPLSKIDMDQYPQALLDDLMARVPVSTVVREYVHDLKKVGAEWEALSPWNAERTPSFKVNDAKGIFHDFSSGNSSKRSTIARSRRRSSGLPRWPASTCQGKTSAPMGRRGQLPHLEQLLPRSANAPLIHHPAANPPVSARSSRPSPSPILTAA